MGILLALLSVIMVLLSLLLVGLILLQKSSGQQGMGAAMGGGVADQAFGAETNTILSKNTQFLVIIYFVLALILFLGYYSRYNSGDEQRGTGVLQSLTLEEAAEEAGAVNAETADGESESPAPAEDLEVQVVDPTQGQ